MVTDPFWGSSFGPSRVLRGLDLTFQVRSDDPVLLAVVEALYGALAVDPGGAPRCVLGCGTTALDGGDGYFLSIDGSVVVRTPARGIAFTNLAFEINQRVIDAGDGVRLHASAVLGPTGAVVMPGVMGAGKSTLAAGLTRRGFAYVTDEAVAFDPHTSCVRPYPKPCSLGRPPAGLAGLWTPPPEFLPYLGATGLVPPEVLGPVATEPAPLALVVLPTYRADAPTEVHELEPVDALATVAAQAFDLGGSPGTLAALGALLEGVPVVRLTSGSLEAAVATVEELVGEVP